MQTAELDLPTIDPSALPPSPQTAVATAAAQALDLEKMDLNAIVRSGFQPARDKAAEAIKTLTGVVHDLSTQAKVDAAKSLRHRLIGQPLADVRKLTTGIKSRLAAASKVAGEEQDKAVAAFAAADALITPQIEAREAELETERQAKAQAEADRKAKHEANLARLTGAAQRARDTGADSAKIAQAIEALEAFPVTESWEEYRERGEAARVAAVGDLQKLHGEVKAREDQAAETERLRRIAAEQEIELQRLRAAEALRQQQEAERLERERIAELEAGAPKPQDDEMVLVDAAAPLPQSAPGGSGATQQGENSHDDQGDGQCPRGLAGEGDDGGPGQRRESVERAGDDRRTEHGAGLLHPLAPRDAGQGVAARLTITQNAQEGSVPADAPAVCASSEPEASNGSPSGSEGPAAQEVLRAADPVELWAVHVEGPDDIEAAPSRAAAEERAEALNTWAAQKRIADTGVVFLAKVVAWPHSAEAHAEDLRKMGYTGGPGSQQVLKAEAATPDATAREIPADESPRGGAMGAGQPAAAGPAGVAPDSEMTAAWPLPTGPRVVFTGPEPEDELRTQTAAFVELVLVAFDTKFPTQPKMSPEWWAQVREDGEALRCALQEAA